MTPANHVYVGTDWGLAYSTNDGQSFRYERGQDYAAKIMGLWHPPQGYRPPPQVALNRLLPGDHITSLAQDLTGNIWIGTWRNGYEVLNPETGKEFKSEDSPALAKADGYISQICPITEISAPKPKSEQTGLRSADRRSGMKIPVRLSQTMLVGRYGFGVSEFARQASLKTNGGRFIVRAAQTNRRSDGAVASGPILPVCAGVPTSQFISRLSAAVEKLAGVRGSTAIPCTLPSDWLTQGDWIDRYGTFADVCATMNGNGCDQAGGYHGDRFSYRSWVGPANGPQEYLRYWVQWNQTGQNRVLQDLGRGGRKESEWDDHGESAAFTKSGLGVYCTFYLPKGVFEISGYCVNKDGHAGTNRDRDYIVSLCRTPVPQALFLALAKNPAAGRRLWVIANSVRATARSDVRHFWGGVYARFAIRQAAPGYVTLAIHRNFSFNTITCGLFVNRVRGDAKKWHKLFMLPSAIFSANKQPSQGFGHGRNLQAKIQLVNNILSLRRRHPLAYMRIAPAMDIPALRCFQMQLKGNNPAMKRVSGLRAALSLLARDAALFRRADGIYPSSRLFETYAWKMRAQFGKAWQWDQKGYDDYMKKKREEFIASR